MEKIMDFSEDVSKKDDLTTTMQKFDALVTEHFEKKKILFVFFSFNFCSSLGCQMEDRASCEFGLIFFSRKEAKEGFLRGREGKWMASVGKSE